jgi:hypothetical protein
MLANEVTKCAIYQVIRSLSLPLRVMEEPGWAGGVNHLITELLNRLILAVGSCQTTA